LWFFIKIITQKNPMRIINPKTKDVNINPANPNSKFVILFTIPKTKPYKTKTFRDIPIQIMAKLSAKKSEFAPIKRT
jgi:hypothetical protein